MYPLLCSIRYTLQCPFTDSDGTIFVNAVTPFIIGVIRKEIVMVRVGEKSRCNMIEGGQKDFYETMVCSLTVPYDWILDMDPFNGNFNLYPYGYSVYDLLRLFWCNSDP